MHLTVGIFPSILIMCGNFSLVKVISGIFVKNERARVGKQLKIAVEKIFQPLAKLLIKAGISYGEASEILKAALVRAATEKLGQSSEQITDTRVHLITGVHRKDVRRIKEGEDSTAYSQSSTPLPAQAFAKWLGDARFQNEDGSPRPLSKKSSDSQDGFEELINSISKDVRPKAVLDEMLSRKMVLINAIGLIEPSLESIISNQPPDDVAKYLGMNIHDHLEVAVNNLDESTDKQLERCVHYFGLSDSAAKELEKFSKKVSISALLKINEKAQELIQEKKNHGNWDANFGVFSYKSEQAQKKDAK